MVISDRDPPTGMVLGYGPMVWVIPMVLGYGPCCWGLVLVGFSVAVTLSSKWALRMKLGEGEVWKPLSCEC